MSLHGDGDAAIDSILKEIGSLEPAKFADLVILESDPRKVKTAAISNIQICETWLNGHRVYGGQANLALPAKCATDYTGY